MLLQISYAVDTFNWNGRCLEMNVNVSDWVHGRTAKGEKVDDLIDLSLATLDKAWF